MGCAKSKDKSLAAYKLEVKTNGSYKDAGSDSCVYINMVGEVDGNATGWLRVDNVHKNDFQKGKNDRFKIKADDIGLPLIIRLELRHRTREDYWACDEVVVKYRETEAVFPVYDWVEDEICFTRGKAFTYGQVQHMAVKGMRSREVEVTKAKYQWIIRPGTDDVGWGLPRFVDMDTSSELPKIFQDSDKREKNLLNKGFEAIINAALASVATSFTKLDNLESYTKLYRFMQNDDDPPFINRWQSDVEFGRQQVQGIVPFSLSRCRKLPDCCQISESDVRDILNSENSLQQEIDSGRIYIGDFSRVFQGVKRNKNSKGEQLYCPDVIGLFFANQEGNLIPIAIQLVPDDPETVFTPKDSDEDWLLAKMYYRTAVANMHEWYYHFLLTHNVMEPFAVSLFRCLPRSHPIYKLLRPHLQTVSSINARARDSLINAGTLANKALAIEGIDLARSTFKTFKMDDLNLPEMLKEKGLNDRDILPKNYFRDDAIALWVIIENFITRVVRHYYINDQDVENDEELQRMATDAALEGFGWQDGNTRGVPTTISTVDQLIRLCTEIIYTSSAGHAAVNFPQYETYQFVPNAPVAMRLPPHKKGEATTARIMKSLPNVEMSVITLTIAYTLSSFSPDEVYLGQYPMRLFTDPETLAIIEDYKVELKKYSDAIKQRNQFAGDDAYTWLLPEKVPNSIAV